MDRRIRELYNDDILKQVAARYGIDQSSLKEHDGFENYIYEYGPDDHRKILRITHNYHRSLEDLNAEMEWLRYLNENGGDVVETVSSQNGLLVEKIDINDSYFAASSISKASGKPPDKSVWDAPLFREWGRAVGRLHRLTKDFKPEGLPRFQWHEEYLVNEFERYLPKEQAIIKEKTSGIIERIKGLETDVNSYGLIHTDIHHGNFFYDNGKISIFDFDDCAYKHFISDIAIAVFYSIRSRNDFKTKEDFAEFFLANFMEGYTAENILGEKWISKLPDFLKLREVILYVAVCRSIDPENPDQWSLNYIKEHKPAIENDVPILKRRII